MWEIIGPTIVIIGGLATVWYVWIRDEDKEHEGNGEGNPKTIPKSIFRELPKDKQDELLEEGFNVIPGA